MTTEAVLVALRLAGSDIVSHTPSHSAWQEAALKEGADREPTAADGAQTLSPRKTPGATRA
jgi:hypothetical protein